MRTALALVVSASSLLAQEAELRVLWRVPLQSTSFGSAAVADADGDGKPEVAFCTYFFDGKVRVLNGEDGSELWSFQPDESLPRAHCWDASLRFADVNADGRLDLVVPVSSGCRVYAFDAKSGKEHWTYRTGANDCIDSPPAIVDTDGDGKPEVVFGSFQKRLHVVDGATGARRRLVTGFDGFVQTCPLVLDLNADGAPDFVAGTFKGDNRLTAVDGKTGAELWHHAVGKADAAQERDPMDMGIYHGASVGDLDGDGAPELVACAYDGRVRCLDAATGAVKWSVAPGDRYFMGPVAIADVDADGRPEVIACSQRLTVIEGDGKVRYSESILRGNTWGGAHRGPSVADLDGDGKADVAYLMDDGHFAVRRGHDGAKLYELKTRAAFTGVVAGNNHGPVLADLDGDGRLDAFYVVGSGDARKAGEGAAVCVTGFPGKGPGWTMLRHDQRNSGNVATPLGEVSPLAGPKAQAAPAEDVFARIDPLVAPLVDARLALGVTVGVLRGGRTAVRGYGRVSKDSDRRPDGDTVYEIGSITKVLTGILLADAVGRGVVALDDPIGKHLPQDVTTPLHREQPIELVHLATHTSALPRMPRNIAPADLEDPFADYGEKQLYRELADTKLGRRPGGSYDYSNLGAGLLGHLLVRAAGSASYEALLTERITGPLGLRDTRVTLSEAMRARLAAPCDDACQRTRNWGFDVLVGCGGVRSTANDLLRFAQRNLDPSALPAEHRGLADALRVAQQVHHQPGVLGGITGQPTLGLGWHFDGKRVLWHNGGTGGYRTHLRIDLDRQCAVVVLANTTGQEVDALCKQVDDVLAGKPVEPMALRKAVEVDAKTLQRYAGRYELAPGTIFDVEVRDGVLRAKLTGQESLPLFPLSTTRFFYRLVQAEIEFRVDAAGAVSGLVLFQHGREMPARRLAK